MQLQDAIPALVILQMDMISFLYPDILICDVGSKDICDVGSKDFYLGEYQQFLSQGNLRIDNLN
ncbi:hypothetical protein C3V39_06155 [Prevotella sp. oral taxon 820]|nr:hypothetical protein C3V39_06155 [Prevotella sp. oral taxon 820]